MTSPEESHQARAVAVATSTALGELRRRWWLAVIGLILYLVLAPDGTHHWHEWRYLYSAAHFSVAELAAGEFDAGPPPARSADEAGAWYRGQLLHEAILSAVVSRLGPGLHTVHALQWLYGLFPPLAALVIFLGLRRLPLRLDPLAVSLVFLLSPVSIYLGFKLMAEGPALLFGALAIWLLNGSLYSPSRVRSVLQAALAGISGALSLLSMVYGPLLLLGYAVALFLVCRREPGPGILAARLLVMLAAALPVAGGLFLHWGVSLGDLVIMYGFFRQYVTPLPVSLFNILLAGSLLWAILPLAWRSPRGKEVRFFGLWAAVSVVPILVLSSNYVEMRFLSVGLIPFAGLVVLAVSKALPWSRAASVALVALPALASLISAPFTPYEMSSRELTAAVQRIRSTHPQGAILVPWNYTDYHFLALAFPHAPVYLVQSPVDAGGRVVRDEWWERKQRRNYGPAYIGNEEDLAGLGRRELFYVGHGPLPPLQNLTRLAGWLRLESVVKMIEGMHPLDHVTQSWMWENPRFAFEESFSSGRYTVYSVRHRTSGAGPAHGTRSRVVETGDLTLTEVRSADRYRLLQVEPPSETLF